MRSQRLIVDTIKTWSEGRLHIQADVLQQDTSYARLWLVTSDPEYYGNPELEIILLWEYEFGLDEHPDWHESVHQLVRSYSHQIKTKIVSVVHKGRTTYVKLKATDETAIAENFDWVDVIAPKPDVI